MEKTYSLKVTSAVVIGGEIKTAGAIVHNVPERVAVNLLERGKVVPASAEDAPAEVAQQAEGAAEDDAGKDASAEGAPPEGKKSRK